MEDQLTTRQVADALNVSESSIKRWCDQGAIPTVRTLGGHRRIPADGFKRFLEETNRQSLATTNFCTEESTAVGVALESADLSELLLRFERAVIDGDATTCHMVLANCYARHGSFSKLADEFIAATFHRLGELWDCGDLEIYQERRGCEVCQQVLHEFRRLIAEASPNAPVAIGAAPAGDHYTLPNQLIELVMRECGWRATNLGSNLPFETIAQAVQFYQPRLLWLSVSHLDDEARFIKDYNEFHSRIPEQTVVIVGGRALHDGLRPKLKYTGHCDSMQQLADFAAALHGDPRKIDASNN